MNVLTLKVVKVCEMTSVKSEKSEGGILNKRNLVLQELGGKFENSYLAMLLGNLATLEFSEGECVDVTLQFRTHEYNGQLYQDIVVTDLIKK